MFGLRPRKGKQLNLVHEVLAKVSRRRKIALLSKFIRSRDIKSVLIIGASATGSAYENLIERFLQEKCETVVVSGIENSSPIWEEWVQADGRDLPFEEKAFDLVFSNAVIEHVGVEPDQIAFISEHKRCGRNWFLTTPNRFFPVEVHSGVIFRHMLGNWVPDGTSRLLSPWQLRKMSGNDSAVSLGFLGATLSAFGPVN